MEAAPSPPPSLPICVSSKHSDICNIYSVDGTFLSWYIDLRKKLLELYPIPDGLERIPDGILLPPKYWLEFKDDSDTTTEKLNLPTEDTGEIDPPGSNSFNSKLASAVVSKFPNLPSNKVL